MAQEGLPDDPGGVTDLHHAAGKSGIAAGLWRQGNIWLIDDLESRKLWPRANPPSSTLSHNVSLLLLDT